MGRIIEAAGRPVLERTFDGHAVGDDLVLEWRGNPISHGMSVEYDVVWSGTHFIYPFWESAGPPDDDYLQLLLPIDCR